VQDKLILDLCGGTGSWSFPYRNAGYTVIIVDPEYKGEGRIAERVEEFAKRDIGRGAIHGILAAPPCTEFCGSGARWWEEKEITNPKYLEEALGIVFACMEVIKKTEPSWWCLENPVGRLTTFLGKPKMYFNPCDFGDPYTKKTCLWGEFIAPHKTPVEVELGSHMASLGPSDDRSKLRSITPPGFTNAFFKANP